MSELLNSECFVGNDWLHNYQTVYQDKEGMLDVCEKCSDEKFWPYDVSNEEYLSYNVRRGLQRNHPLFEREWGHITI